MFCNLKYNCTRSTINSVSSQCSCKYATDCTINQWWSQPDNLVMLSYANISMLIDVDCKKNQFPKKWIMMIENLNSMTKYLGRLRYCFYFLWLIWCSQRKILWLVNLSFRSLVSCFVRTSIIKYYYTYFNIVLSFY